MLGDDFSVEISLGIVGRNGHGSRVSPFGGWPLRGIRLSAFELDLTEKRNAFRGCSPGFLGVFFWDGRVEPLFEKVVVRLTNIERKVAVFPHQVRNGFHAFRQRLDERSAS